MKRDFVLPAVFGVGVLLGAKGWHPDVLVTGDVSKIILCLTLLFIGIGLGANRRTIEILKLANPKIILVPCFTILGTFAAVALASVFIRGLGVRECIAVGAGFGYYSLSSIVAAHVGGSELGAITLMANILREAVTLLAAPLLVRYFGRLAPIAAGGATSMDVALPVITRYAGEESAVVAVFSGFVVSVLVPFLVILPFHVG